MNLTRKKYIILNWILAILAVIAFMFDQTYAIVIIVMLSAILSVITELEISRILNRPPKKLYIVISVLLFILLFGHLCFTLWSEYFR